MYNPNPNEPMSLNRCVWTIFAVLVLSTQVNGSIDSTRKSIVLDTTTFNNLKEEFTFKDSSWQLELRDWSQNSSKNKAPLNVDPSLLTWIGVLLEGLFYLLVVIVVVALIYSFVRDYKSFKKDPRLKKTNFDLDEIDDIEDVDFSESLKAALASGDYRLAIRVQYLMSLQRLTSKGLITWAKEKTNRHYVREVEKLSLSNHFKNASRVFEYIWYGNITLDRDAYEKYLTFFDLLNSQL